MYKTTFSDIRDTMTSYKGCSIKCRVTHSKNKIEEMFGTVTDAYPKLFTMFVESKRASVSYTYAEILTKELEVELV